MDNHRPARLPHSLTPDCFPFSLPSLTRDMMTGVLEPDPVPQEPLLLQSSTVILARTVQSSP